jgi:hypothetical protein
MTIPVKSPGAILARIAQKSCNAMAQKKKMGGAAC